MNPRLQYELRGWAYWTKCLNPLRDTIAIDDLPLGLRLRAYKRDAVGRGLYRRKVHEPALTSFLLDRFPTSSQANFIDVGANLGYFTCLMAKLAGPPGKVVAIEPEPRNFKLLGQNVARNHLTNVALHPCALGASEGFAALGLYKGANRGRHSIVNAAAQSRIRVPLRTLDEVARESSPNVRSWSLVKIDVEGYEGFVIEGAKETLPRTDILVMEFSPALVRTAGGDPVTTLRTLSSCFPRFYRVEGTSLAPIAANDCLASDNQMELVLER